MKAKFKDSFETLCKHVQRHNGLMIIASSIVTALALFFTIYWNFDENSLSVTVDYLYLAGHIFFLVTSALLTALLVVSKHTKIKMSFLVIYIHLYVLLLIAWVTMDCVLDMRYGLSPQFYLMIFTAVAGLYVLEPLFFGVVVTGSFTTVFAYAFKDHAAFFSGTYRAENIMTFIMYIIIIVLIAGEHFGITVNDYRIEKELEHLTYHDGLTGLLNERSYLKEIEEVDKFIEQNKLTEYAIILMDVNNIKVTNDTYGHRYGCHLIVRCGKMIPEFFKTSKMFHLGGDEFVIIVYGNDYKHLDEILKAYEEKLSYSLIQHEGVELIFSVAYGYAKYESGMKYKDVLQKADNAMYENKKAVKAKYGLKQR